MPYAKTPDGVQLHYEESGEGQTIVFVHEFAGDHRSWEAQMRYFSRRYRCVAYSARGYTPSDIPSKGSMYSQDIARDDILAILDHLDVEKGHIVGLSMGGFATLHFGIHYSERAHSLVVAGCGYGAEPDRRTQFREETEKVAEMIQSSTGDAFAEQYAQGPTRVQFQNKDPRGWADFRDQLAEHSLDGAAFTMRGVQSQRPSLFDLEADLREITVPMLVLTGDEDEPCLIPNIYLKRTVPSAALQILPNTGHTINIEEPAAFNAAVSDFLAQVEAGRWPQRDPRSTGTSIIGMR
tara:strand:+ start:2256 stop:3137 length:882 start_codon:yes stop_codon:yes gene_type:complete